MARTKQIAGGIVLAVMTAAVAAGAAYALWLGLPLLNPAVERFDARDIPVINTDARIVRPLPSADATPQAGVVNPGSLWARPKASAVVHRPAAKHRSTAVARAYRSTTLARASSYAGTDEGESDSD